jgi:hypothetical protein
VFAGVGERTREGNDLYREMIESVSGCDGLRGSVGGGGLLGCAGAALLC